MDANKQIDFKTWLKSPTLTELIGERNGRWAFKKVKWTIKAKCTATAHYNQNIYEALFVLAKKVVANPSDRVELIRHEFTFVCWKPRVESIQSKYSPSYIIISITLYILAENSE